MEGVDGSERMIRLKAEVDRLESNLTDLVFQHLVRSHRDVQCR
jgi:hypothetical protein